MKSNRLFRRVSLFTFGTCLITGAALSAPASLFEGINFDSAGNSFLKPNNTTTPVVRNNMHLYTHNGGILMYSGVDPSTPSYSDGGITFWGNPVNIVLESTGTNPNQASFVVAKGSDWGTTQPLFKIDASNGNSTFTDSNVSINSGSLSVGGALSVTGNQTVTGSLSVGGSPALTSASAASVLTGQNFVQLGSGGVLNIVSTTNSTSSTTGAVTVAGGIGVAKDSFINGIRIGRGPGSNIIVTSSNTAIGANTLSANYSGTSNVALGYDALKSGVSASQNTALGYNSLRNHVSGNSNTAVGHNSLQNSTTAIYNTAVGSSALSATTTGSANSAMGMNALTANTTGTSNNAIGLSAMQSNTTGSMNIAVGVGALGPNSTGGSNTAIGHIALAGNTTGGSNVAIGHQAARYRVGDTTGLNNTNSIHIGANTRSLGVTDENSIVIGTNGEGAGSNTTVLGNSYTTHTYLKGETNSASLRVTGATVLEGDVVLAEAQGDISMGDYQ